MKKMLVITFAALVFPLSVFAADVDWTPILEWVKGLAPWINYVFMGLGILTTIGTFIDGLIPDEKDGGFMKKALAIPILGSLLAALTKFSPFNYKQS